MPFPTCRWDWFLFPLAYNSAIHSLACAGMIHSVVTFKRFLSGNFTLGKDAFSMMSISPALINRFYDISQRKPRSCLFEFRCNTLYCVRVHACMLSCLSMDSYAADCTKHSSKVQSIQRTDCIEEHQLDVPDRRWFNFCGLWSHVRS